MPPNYTERSRITLPKSVAERFAVCAKQLEAIRLVPHTVSDAILVGIDFCERTMPKTVQVLVGLYVPRVGEQYVMKIRRDVLGLALNNAKALGVSRQAYLESIATLFSRSLLTQIWRNKGLSLQEMKAIEQDIVPKPSSKSYLNLPSARSPTAKTRKLKLKREQASMRYHKYIEDFKAYMQERGGLSSLLDRAIALDIHARPILGNVGYAHADDVPIESNAKRRYRVRVWKRGRGYNITVLDEIGAGPGESDAVVIPIGSVFRLYDIYRNINWNSITITEE